MPERRSPATEVLLSIGGIVGHLVLRAAPQTFVAQLMERYGPYAIPAAPWVRRTFSLEVRFTAAVPVEDPEVRASEVAGRPLRVEESPELLRITRWDFAAMLTARAGGRGAAGIAFEGGASCQMNPFAFDSLLRVLWAVFLPRAGGALFHACAFRIGEDGVIFPGESGAGKSTLARKVPEPERILTDELVAASRGPIGQWRISGTPFWGEFKRGGGSLRSWPLTAVAFLAQSDRLEARPIPRAEASFRLLACLLCFRADADSAARNLAIAIDLCTEVPSLVLQSRHDSTMAEIEARLAPHLPGRDPPATGRGRGRGRDEPGARPRLVTLPSAREMISELRWALKANGRYAYTPRGSSMRPWLRDGDALFIEAAEASRMVPGDVVLYWTPGPRPDDDRLTCHRLVARGRAGRRSKDGAGEGEARLYLKGDSLSSIERFRNGRESEVLGRVSAVSRDGRAVPVPGRVGSLARLVGSLVATPFLKMVGR
jgi:hypothetical protein